MGVVYKLKEEIANYIIEKKKKEPAISCRSLVFLIKQEFNKEISKSSVNSVIKNYGLSMPVGRRRVLEQGSYEFESAGVFFLKAADCLLGGSLSISEAVNKCFEFGDEETLNKIEYLIYGGLLDVHGNETVKSNLFGRDFKREDMLAYLVSLQSVKELCPEITKVISELHKEIRILKLNLTDKSVVYLDGQTRSVWPSPKIPVGFSAAYYEADRYVKKIFLGNEPLVLFMSPGYDVPTEEFFNLIYCFNGQKSISSAAVYDHNLIETQIICQSEPPLKQSIVFGLWPWQFGQYREVKSMGGFKPFYFIPADKTYYIAETTMELSGHNKDKKVILSGCVLKSSPKGKEIVSIWANFGFEWLKSEEIAAVYLNKWPNLKEGFVNFSRNVENFSLGLKDRGFLSIEKTNINPFLGVKKLLDAYLGVLDSFVRLNFLPDGYEKGGFSAIKDKFYDLKGIFIPKRNEIIIKFLPSINRPNIKELKYACNRVNERNAFIGSKKLWLLI